MENIVVSLESVKNMQGLQEWLNGDSVVSSYIGILGGRRFQKEGCGGSLALKDLIRKADTLFDSVDSKSTVEEQTCFSQAVQKIHALDRVSEQQLMSSNYFQRMLTDLKQFFGNRKYNWREVLPTMLSVSTALSQLNTEFLKREKIRRFVQDNIKEMVVAVRENRDLKKSLERAIGTVKLKSQVRDNIAYLYLRIPATEGDIKSVEQKIYMLGPRKGTFAYSKPLGDNEDDKMENREKIEKECQHSRTINEGNFTNVIEVERVYSRKDKKKLKGTETKWMDKGTLLDLTLACLQNPSELSEEQRHWLAICIAKGLACIHDRNLVHLDLKPSNILVAKKKKNRLKAYIFDYDTADKEGQISKEMISLPTYCAPECFANKWIKTAAVDLWALGLILLELFQGLEKNPYLDLNAHMTGVKKEEETVAIVQLFLDGEFEQLQDLYRRVHDVTISEIDEECVATPIIKELIDLDPTKRPRADEVVKKLESLFHDRYK